MMYHVNPFSGEVERCKNRDMCHVALAPAHVSSKKEALSTYRERVKQWDTFLRRSVIPQNTGTRTVAVYDLTQPSPLSLATKLMRSAPLHARLVIENGQVWEKTSSVGEDAWKFVAGEYEKRYSLIPGSAYNGNYVRWVLEEHGGRLEVGGRRRELLASAFPAVGDAYQRDAAKINEELHRILGLNASVKQLNSRLIFTYAATISFNELTEIKKALPQLTYVPAEPAKGKRDESFTYQPR